MNWVGGKRIIYLVPFQLILQNLKFTQHVQRKMKINWCRCWLCITMHRIVSMNDLLDSKMICMFIGNELIYGYPLMCSTRITRSTCLFHHTMMLAWALDYEWSWAHGMPSCKDIRTIFDYVQGNRKINADVWEADRAQCRLIPMNTESLWQKEHRNKQLIMDRSWVMPKRSDYVNELVLGWCNLGVEEDRF